MQGLIGVFEWFNSIGAAFSNLCLTELKKTLLQGDSWGRGVMAWKDSFQEIFGSYQRVKIYDVYDIHNVMFYTKAPKKPGRLPLGSNIKNKTSGKCPVILDASV